MILLPSVIGLALLGVVALLLSNDYLWINDSRPVMVMHPIKPALDGKDLSDFKDPKGKKLFVEFANVCREKNEGTVDYLWPKPGQEEPVEKRSYVKIFRDFHQQRAGQAQRRRAGRPGEDLESTGGAV